MSKVKPWAQWDATGRAIKVPGSKDIPVNMSRIARDERQLRRNPAVVGTSQIVSSPIIIAGGDIVGATGIVDPVVQLCKYEGKPYDWREFQLTIAPVGNAAGKSSWVIPPVANPFVVTQPEVTQMIDGAAVLKITWGMGAVRSTMWADYPYCGGVVGLAGDYIEVSAQVRQQSTWSDGTQLPRFGAWLTPGVPSNEHPLTYSEPQATWNVAPREPSGITVSVTVNGVEPDPRLPGLWPIQIPPFARGFCWGWDPNTAGVPGADLPRMTFGWVNNDIGTVYQTTWLKAPTPGSEFDPLFPDQNRFHPIPYAASQVQVAMTDFTAADIGTQINFWWVWLIGGM